MRLILLLVLSVFTLVPALAHPVRDTVSAAKLPEQAKWQFGDQVFSDTGIVNIDVVELDDGSFRAYYMYSDGIRSAISTDQGLTFTLESGLRIASAQHSAVLELEDGRTRIYYSTGSSGGVISAISSDGLNFTTEAGIRVPLGAAGEPDAGAIIHPVIIALADGSGFRIYYDADAGGTGDTNDWKGIRSAFSADGLNFTKDEGFRVSESTNLKFASLVWSPFIEYDADDELYKLYVSNEGSASKQGVILATSTDGLDFSVIKKPIVKRDKRLGPNSPGVGGLPGLPQDVFIINVDEGKRMFYWSAGDHGIYSALLED